MKGVSIIGVDLARQVFQPHGATADGEAVFRKKLSRNQFLISMEAHPRCCVAIEACATAHHWARMLTSFGNEVQLIAPKFVAPHVKTQKNDVADAEALVEAATRPTMRFVEIKMVEHQGLGMFIRSRKLQVDQRTQTINVLRGHLAEFDPIASKGREKIEKLRSIVDPEDGVADLPASVRQMAQVCLYQIADLSRRIEDIDAKISAVSRRSRFSARRQKMPGVGPVTAMALAAFAPPIGSFRRAPTSRLGWGSCHGSIRVMASKGSGARASPVSEISGAC